MPKTPKAPATRSERCAMRAVAKTVIPANECPAVTRLAQQYLEGNFEFFGVQQEPLVRLLLENNGVDVDAMLVDYRLSM